MRAAAELLRVAAEISRRVGKFSLRAAERFLRAARESSLRDGELLRAGRGKFFLRRGSGFLFGGALALFSVFSADIAVKSL